MLLASSSVKNPRHPRGFTLMEVVIAITVGAMVMGILSVALSLSIKAWERSRKPFKTEIYDLMDLLSTQLVFLNTSPITYRSGTGPLFIGRKNEIFFATNFSPMGRSMNCPVIVHYRFDEEKHSISYRQMVMPGTVPEGSTLVDDFINTQKESEALMTVPSVAAFSFKYFDQESGQAIEIWGKPGSFPVKILVEARLPEGQEVVTRSSYPNLFGVSSQAAPSSQPSPQRGKK